MNALIGDRDRWLRVPDLKFNRRIGQYAHQHWTIDGEPISEERYAAYLESVMPKPADYHALRSLMKENDWITPKKADMPDTN
jgi:hypothetical protein